ncbi:MAG: putative Ig domain-containing protein [Terriglobales bacterium]
MRQLPCKALSLLFIGLTASHCSAQQAPQPNSFSVSNKTLPKASLWEHYLARLQASGGTEPYHWRVVDSSLPRTLRLSDEGIISGGLDQPGEFQFTVLVRDNSRPPKQAKQTLMLRTETPLTAHWVRKAQVDDQRIDGSIKVSNHSGRDFDLTFVVLAVNDIGRATAIGYQRFPLTKNTMDMEIPFGETLSAGNYAVNIDVVGEEPISKHIFRARLVTEKESITQGP